MPPKPKKVTEKAPEPDIEPVQDYVPEPSSTELAEVEPEGRFVGDDEVEWDLPRMGSIDVCPACGRSASGTGVLHTGVVLSGPCGKHYGEPGYRTFPAHLCVHCGCGNGWYTATWQDSR